MMSKQWRHAVVGVGTVGEWHVRAIPLVEGSSLGAGWDNKPDKARPHLGKNQREDLPIYADLREMLDKEQIDVVHICTPSGDHMTPVIIFAVYESAKLGGKPVEVR